MFNKYIKLALAIAIGAWSIFEFTQGNIGNGISLLLLAGIFVFFFYKNEFLLLAFLKLRSQDVMHYAYMQLLRYQMNCVPGMITEFAFTPTITTADMRMNSDVVDKVNRINKIRYENSKELTANGEEALEPYQFDYLLLCAKICGASHYNMQMKIVVESEKDYEKWLSEQKTFSETIQ